VRGWAPHNGDLSATERDHFDTSIAPWLAVSDAHKAVEYYKAAFGAVEVYRLEDDDGKLAVAQLSIKGAEFWVQQDSDASPKAEGAGSVRLILSVEDPDAVFEEALAKGGEKIAGMSEGFGWRTGRVTDPSGQEWEISRRLGS
jgi:PhnB protein